MIGKWVVDYTRYTKTFIFITNVANKLKIISNRNSSFLTTPQVLYRNIHVRIFVICQYRTVPRIYILLTFCNARSPHKRKKTTSKCTKGKQDGYFEKHILWHRNNFCIYSSVNSTLYDNSKIFQHFNNYKYI